MRFPLYVLRYLWVALCTAFWGTLALPVMLFDRSGEGIIWCGRQWVSWIFRGCGVKLDVTGIENVDRRAPQIFMPNHQSVWDVVAIIRAVPVSFRFVAKKEIKRLPFIGWAAVGGGHIIIDRSDHQQSVTSLQRAVDRIRNGTNVILYPEGTRSPSGQLRAFKSGGFHLAIESGVPIVPVSVSGSQHITRKHSLRIDPGRLRIVFGKPIQTAHLDLEDRERLKEAVRGAMLEGFDVDLQGREALRADA